MEYQNYLDKKKHLYTLFLSFIDSEGSAEEESKNLFDYFIQLNYQDDSEELVSLLRLVKTISQNHQRNPNFYNRIEKILLLYKDSIKQTLSNIKLYNFFHKDKMILLILFKHKILELNESISKKISNDNYLCHFFYPEISPYLENYEVNCLKRELLSFDSNIFDSFELMRQKGENDSNLCRIIREDLIDEFIIYINKNSISLSASIIKPSIFETNYFLNSKKQISLIEYAAFYGSVQIFQYLKSHNVVYKPSLWLFAIHGRSSEIIMDIEDSKISPPDLSYKKCIKEAMKCHHNEIAQYIQTNLFNEEYEPKSQLDYLKKFVDNFDAYIFKYHNYELMPNIINNSRFTYYLIYYNYYNLVKLLFNEKDFKFECEIV